MMLATSLAPSPKQPCDAARVTGVDCVVRNTGVGKDIARNAAGMLRFYHQGPRSPRSTRGDRRGGDRRQDAGRRYDQGHIRPRSLYRPCVALSMTAESSHTPVLQG